MRHIKLKLQTATLTMTTRTKYVYPNEYDDNSNEITMTTRTKCGVSGTIYSIMLSIDMLHCVQNVSELLNHPW